VNAPAPALPRTVEGLLDAARAATGLQDFGADLGFMKGLRVLVDAAPREARLNAIGEQLVYGGILRLLVNRLRYVRDVGAHPEILDERIVKPIVVIGLPRTGTSKLQRVLSADPEAQRLDLWKQQNPAPFPDEVRGAPTARIEAARQIEQMLTTMFPGFQARHPLEAEEPDEELHLMEGSFDCMLSWVFTRLPTFRQHVDASDPRPMYRWLLAMLQYLQWQDGGGRGRPWMMKSPTHIGVLDRFLEIFPDAILVHTHRDPRAVIPSFASLITEARKVGSDQVDPVEVGRDMFDYWSSQMDRYLVLRDRLPPDRVLDVQFDEVRSDVVGVIRRIYALAGRQLTPQAIQAFRAYEARRPEHHFGSYEYTAEDHGLTLGQIDRRFAAYRRRYLR
jgi:hypothetical protein